MGRVCDYCSRELPDVPEYVEVDENQEFPDIPLSDRLPHGLSLSTAYRMAQRDMREANWVKCKK